MITLRDFLDLRIPSGPWITIRIIKNGELVKVWDTCDKESNEMIRIYGNAIVQSWHLSRSSFSITCRE